MERVLNGDTYAAIAKVFGIPESAVANFKKSLDQDERDAQKKIPQGRRRACQLARAVSQAQSTNPRADPLYDQISKAIPREIGPALRNDMISDTYMEVLEGRLALGDIQKGANASKRRVFSQYANRWGDISLDAPISSDATRTIGDSIADPERPRKLLRPSGRRTICQGAQVLGVLKLRFFPRQYQPQYQKMV